MTFPDLLLLFRVFWWIQIGKRTFNSSILLENIDQLAILVHLKENVTSADEFSVDEDLRNRWPTAEIFNALSQVIVRQHIV